MAKTTKKAAPKKSAAPKKAAAKKAAAPKKTAPKKAATTKKAAPKKVAEKKVAPAKGVTAKKELPKKAAKKAVASLGRKAPSSSFKNTAAKRVLALPKKAAAKKVGTKKERDEKEVAQREANRIINSSPKGKGKKPVKSRSKNENSSLLDAIIAGLQEKKAKNITILNMTGIGNSVADYFVIADAESRTHVDAIADSVEFIVSQKTGEKAYHTEGHQVGEWILVDYIDIVVHVFQKEIRDYYNIEALWADAEITKID